MPSQAERVISCGETRICQPSERECKNGACHVHVSCFGRACLTVHVLQLEKAMLCVPSVLPCVVEAFGGNADSGDVEGAQLKATRIPRGAVHHDFLKASVEKDSVLRTRVRHRWSALFAHPPSQWADIS